MESEANVKSNWRFVVPWLKDTEKETIQCLGERGQTANGKSNFSLLLRVEITKVRENTTRRMFFKCYTRAFAGTVDEITVMTVVATRHKKSVSTAK